MLKTEWSAPIEIGFGTRGYRTVIGPFDALAYMIDASLWPVRTGALFVKAKIACKAALEGRVSTEEARDAFLAAAEEAKLITH